jgi:hypothetical protein
MANPPPEVPPEHRLEYSQQVSPSPYKNCVDGAGLIVLQADFERMGLNTYGGIRMVRQNELNLCLTYPLELLFPATMTDAELVAVAK